MAEDSERGQLGDAFDRVYRSLHGIPDAIHTKPSTKRHVSPVLELSQTFIVQTARHKELGDYVFIEYIGKEGSIRICLPPEVAAVIARQRDALTDKSRKLAARQQAAVRKAAGIQPAFLKGRKKPRAKKGKADESGRD